MNNTHPQGARLPFERVKPRVSSWTRGPCLVSGCRKAIVRPGVCGEHAEALLEEVRSDLRAAGSSAEVVSVSLNEGYVTAKLSEAQSFGRPVHRIAMEAILGRSLARGENVHHINGNRSDNRPENLELWVSAQPSGQRPDDLATYARLLLARYGTDEERQTYGDRRGPAWHG